MLRTESKKIASGLGSSYFKKGFTATQQNRHASFHFIFLSGDLREEWGDAYRKTWSDREMNDS